MRGGEKVLEALCEIFPQADVYSLVVDPDSISDKITSHNIRSSFVQKIPGALKHYQSLLPLYPIALEQFDLSGYDLVISSESGPAKGVLTRPETCHICYCHTPMRYLWDMYHDYRRDTGWLKRLAMVPLAHYLRQWDLASASRVDYFVANSRHVARRISKHYRRNSEVIHPPVATGEFGLADEQGDFYLMVGQLVKYKRPDLAVEAFSRLGKPLVVIGEGEELGRLKGLAGPSVKFLGRQPFSVIKDHYARCRAFIFPGEEDFGITPVEAQASGRPVIAFARGGALETVVDGETGFFFAEPTVESLNEAILKFETLADSFDPRRIREHSLAFDKSVFNEKIRSFIDARVAEHFEKFRGAGSK
ncbi:glycosyl transferase [Desulfuromonas versatilis]|uniref:Glycosyl transferase n=2 Tax=Desulfuromonas versatilis TaxID=2802975 RepID=A0ABM8HUE6_9BACT|nr:glycosyl transferase [Desulfuromonas versatilis]